MIPWWGTRAAPTFLLLGMEKCPFPFLPPSLSAAAPPREALALPPGKRVSAFWMRASTTPTTWMEETEAKSSCTGSLRDRGGRGIRKGFWETLTLWCSFLRGAEPKGETAKGVVGWEVALFPVPETSVRCWRPTVLEAIHVTSALGLSLFLCYFTEWLSECVLSEGTCCLGSAWTRET